MQITVFTPTYNRAHLLPRLYKSLCAQTCKDFEWIIVDDGSADDTKSIVDGFIHDCAITIRYFRQENGGKHRAINRGVKEAKGNLFFITDSDDILPEKSIETVLKQYEKAKNQAPLGGVCGLDQTFDGKIIGNGLPTEHIVSNSIDIRMRHGVDGDLKEVFLTSVLKEFPFPEIEGEKFCPEALVWFRIARKYNLYFFNQPIYNVEYQTGGLTDYITEIRMKSPVSTTTLYYEMVNDNISFSQKVKSSINYWRFRFCISRNFKIAKLPFIWSWTMPIGYLMHKKDIKNYRTS